MTNIPDLTNAKEGETYEGPDGKRWVVWRIERTPTIWMYNEKHPVRGHFRVGDPASDKWRGFEKVE